MYGKSFDLCVPKRWQENTAVGWMFLGYGILPFVLRRCIPDLYTGICIFFGVNFAVTLALFFPFLKESRSRFREDLRYSVKWLLIGLAIFVGTAALLIFLIHFFGQFSPFWNIIWLWKRIVAPLVRKAPLLMFLYFVFALPITEEAFFRGAMLSGLRRQYWSPNLPGTRFTQYLSITLTYAVAVFLPLYPLLGRNYVEMSLAGFLLAIQLLIPASVAFCVSYEYSGTVWTSILLHAGINVVLYILALVL